MLTADPLSRRPDHEEGVELDNRNKTLLKTEFFANFATELATLAIESSHQPMAQDDELLRGIRKALLDDKVTKGYKDLLESGPREFGKSLKEWNYESGLLLYRGKVYVPKEPKSLREQVLRMHHDHPTAGHFGRWKTYELISRNYWWPGLTNSVKQYVT